MAAGKEELDLVCLANRYAIFYMISLYFFSIIKGSNVTNNICALITWCFLIQDFSLFPNPRSLGGHLYY